MEKLSVELKTRIGILARIKQRMPKNKLIIISEAVFNSKIKYGIAAYITLTFEREDLKHKKLRPSGWPSRLKREFPSAWSGVRIHSRHAYKRVGLSSSSRDMRFTDSCTPPFPAL